MERVLCLQIHLPSQYSDRHLHGLKRGIYLNMMAFFALIAGLHQAVII